MTDYLSRRITMKRIALLILTAVVLFTLNGCAAVQTDRAPMYTEARSPCFCRLIGYCFWRYDPYNDFDFYADRTRPLDYTVDGYYIGDEVVPLQCKLPLY
jgi:hypothetical protein